MNSQTKILSFEAIPVIDLMAGKVVRARHGERDNYRPVVSQLCAGSDPLEVMHALLGLYPFKTAYIADLDAIRNQQQHLKTCADLRRFFPKIEFWIDAGFSDIQACNPWLDIGFKCVIGSESQPNANATVALLKALGKEHAILSLDYSASVFLGPQELLLQDECWPERVIAMTLGRVGSYSGPDFDLLKNIKLRAGSSALFAAGGVRNMEDIMELKKMEINGALLASTLHDGLISGPDLVSINAA